MSGELEQAIREMLKEVVLEVVRDVVPHLQRLPATQTDFASNDEELLLRPREAAKLLTISQRTLFELTKAGKIPCVRINRLVRYSTDALRAWITRPDGERTLDRSAKGGSRTAKNPADTTTLPAPVKPRKQRKPRVTKQRPESSTPNAEVSAVPIVTRSRPNDTRPENRPRNFRDYFAARMAVDPEVFPALTNGKLREIAQVDIATYSNWVYRDGQMPEEAMQRLQEFFLLPSQKPP